MSSNSLRTNHSSRVVAALGIVAAMAAAGTSSAVAQTAPRDGLVCTTGAAGTPRFDLTTKTGTINLPDGNRVAMWGFSAGTNGFQHPSPVLCVTEGDTVTVVLHNTLTPRVSITFPGQEAVTADGAPSQPQFDGSGNLTSFTKSAPKGGSVTYQFTADRPGTFIYQSGTDPAIQVRMGLFGVIVVRPTLGPDYANNRTDSRFNPADEVLVLLSEIDPYLNRAVSRNKSFNLANYHPRYWLINGRGFPDSVAPNNASWLPNQPYGSLARVYPWDPVDNPYPGVARYVNVGTTAYPFHPHGNNGRAIARDGFPLEGTGGADLSFERFSINLGPGQTWDVLYRWKDAEGYNEANPVPITVPQPQNLFYGEFFSGSAYLGTQGFIPVGTPNVNECGEYYIISHNHALFQITSWGVPMTGPITYLRIDPPQPNTCSQ